MVRLLGLLVFVAAAVIPAAAGPRRRVGGMTMLAFDEPSQAEGTLARHWYFTRKIKAQTVNAEIERPMAAPITSIVTPKLVQLKEDRTVDFGNGEVGIWNYKPDKQIIEMEFDLKNDDSTYLLYQAKLKQGKYYRGVVKFGEEGQIFLVKGLPFRWNKKLVGTFSGKPVGLPKPTVNMKV